MTFFLALYAAAKLSSVLYVLVLRPETERLSALYFDACLLKQYAPDPQTIAGTCKQQEH